MINGIANIINSTNGILAEVLTYLFSAPSLVSILSLNVFATYIGQPFLPVVLPNSLIVNCFDNKFRFFLFIVLLTLL